MKKPKFFIRLMAAWALILVGGACDDAGPALDPMAMGGSAMGGAGGGGTGGLGGMPGMPCAGDNFCMDGQYCDRAPEGGIGECREGCRSETDSCTMPETCDVTTRMCTFVCTSDDDCVNPEEYCDVDSGECVPGCRSTEVSCVEPDMRGRARVCDEESRMCVSLYPCCTADGCSDELTGACESSGGTVLMGAATCSANPCGEACEEDADCGEDANRYCNTEDGRCADGCRLDFPGSCPEQTTCDPDKRTCEEVRCIEDADCPAYQLCDLETSLCRDGCRDDTSCPAGQRCIDSECQEVCDPDDANACGDNRYCDADSLSCEDSCGSHDDCADPGRFCNEDNQCVLGCRDDEGEAGEPNNDAENAVAIVLGEANENSVRSGGIDGRIICGNDHDLFTVTVGPFERIRVDLHFDRAEGNLDLELEADCDTPDGIEPPNGCSAFEDGPIVADSVNVPERIEFPGADSDITVQNGLTYHIKVYGSGSDLARRLDYRIAISTVDARSGCFPDPRDLADPNDDEPQNATVVPEQGDDYLSNICLDDSDYFAIEMLPNDGLQIELRPDQDLELVGYFYAEGQPLGDPILTSANNYRFSAEVGDGAFAPAGTWFLLIRAANEATGEYGLTINRFSSAACGTDGGTEPNGTTDTAVRIDVPVIEADAPMGELPAQDLEMAICTEGRPDVDILCFDVEEGEILEAAVQTEDVNGALDVQFLDAAGAFVGENANSNSAGDPLNVATVLQTMAGTYCIRISGLDGAQGGYTLSAARRARPEGLCALDRDEGQRRNDEGDTALELMSLEPEALSYRQSSYICDLEDRIDEDWFRLTIPEERSSLCVTLDRFDRTVNDVDVAVFRDAAVQGGQGCNDHADCAAVDATSACVNGRCAAAISEDIGSVANFAMVHLNRDRIGGNNGDYLVRVTHRDGNEGPYTVNANITPESEECGDDIREPNDSDPRSTALGSGDVAICNSWICERDRRDDEDWYNIEVPAGEDRTVMIAFGSSEGRLFMNIEGPPLPEDPLSGFVWGQIAGLGADPRQCINIRGGSEDTTVSIQVEDAEFAGRNNRIDYSLRVVSTDLEMGDRADGHMGYIGECARLGGNARACPPREEWVMGVQDLDCWPTLILP